MNAAVVILTLVTLQRLMELVIARRNTRALLARDAYEAAPGHYPLIVAVHVGWLLTLFWLAPGKAISWPLLGIFLLLQLARLWVLASLGVRWTTRIIVLPGAPLVAKGPFRFLRHPNYAIVAAEILVLPLAFGLWQVALIFSGLNAAVLAIRIKAEEKALKEARP